MQNIRATPPSEEHATSTPDPSTAFSSILDDALTDWNSCPISAPDDPPELLRNTQSKTLSPIGQFPG